MAMVKEVMEATSELQRIYNVNIGHDGTTSSRGNYQTRPGRGQGGYK